MRLFAYGTLLEPRVLEKVIGSRRDGDAASLAGYRRYHFRNATYPGIVPQAGASVDGIVYGDINPLEWRRLDEFEGEMYERVEVTVTDEAGGSIAAATYVVLPAYRDLLSDHDWDFAYFRKVHLARYIDLC